MNILMVSYNPYGMLGTSGTYNLSEAYAKKSNFTLLCNSSSKINQVYKKSNNFDIIEKPQNKYFNAICEIVQKKKIKVIIFTVSILFLRLIPQVKNKFKDIKCVLDLKSPRLSDKRNNNSFNKKTSKIQKQIDLIITPSFDNIETWITNYKGKYFIYDLGINLEDFEIMNFTNKEHCKKFVYIGQIHPKREIMSLLNHINNIPRKIRDNCVFDFYGDGHIKNKVQRFCKNKSYVNFKGLLPQKKLFKVLSTYDVGLTWIPKKLYTNSPSLKFIEYMAAGVYPIATDTKLHISYQQHFDFKIFNDERTFTETIVNLYNNGIKKEGLERNYNSIQKYDWNCICDNILGELSKWK